MTGLQKRDFPLRKNHVNSSLLPDFTHVSMQCILYLYFQPICPIGSTLSSPFPMLPTPAEVGSHAP